MTKEEYVARLVVVERAITNLAQVVAQLRQDTLDDMAPTVVESCHDNNDDR